MTPTPSHARAFTLIELLVVVGIISILASIALPNFLEAQTRAKVARMQADMRTVTTALETYSIDNNRYPYRRQFPERQNNTLAGIGDARTRMDDLKVITTPVAYLAAIPVDVFEIEIPAPDNIIDYWNGDMLDRISFFNAPAPPWVLVSVGPDTVMGQPGTWGGYQAVPFGTPGAFSIRWPYDPTNGTISGGNIYRYAGGVDPMSVSR